MRIVVVGAGPTGLFLGMALSRRGHGVTVVDRDRGPRPDGSWPRRGVMQFHHPHAFRAQVVEALQAELPDTWDALLAAGAEPMMAPTGPDGPGELMGIRCRRLVFERVLRAAAAREPGLTLRVGHVDGVTTDRGHVTGVRVDGHSLEADLVVVASGRARPAAPRARRPPRAARRARRALRPVARRRPATGTRADGGTASPRPGATARPARARYRGRPPRRRVRGGRALARCRGRWDRLRRWRRA